MKEEAKEKFAILNPGDDDKLSTNNNEAGDFGAKNPAWEEEVKKHHAALKAMTADVAAVVAAAPKADAPPAAAATAVSEANLATAAKGNDILSAWSSVHKPRPAAGFELKEAFECEIKGLRSAVEEDGTLTCPTHCL